ncbi:MAG: hypothetical protein NTY48_06850 [Candidatus Diapherotrites archaeon]|nr:hypothetical protein [Candidatus Diapherotrites archaeon]
MPRGIGRERIFHSRKRFLTALVNSVLEGKKREKISRDLRLIELVPQRQLVVKDHPGGLLASQELFAFMKKNSKQKNFSLVPVKGVVTVQENNLISEVVVQRYFERPSIQELMIFLNPKRFSKENSVALPSVMSYVGPLAIKYCKRLLEKYPLITYKKVNAARAELMRDLSRSPQATYAKFDSSNYLVFGFDEKSRSPQATYAKFDSSNYLVFGFDEKRGVPKIGVIDL